MFANIRADFEAHGCDWGAQGFWALVVYPIGRWRFTVQSAILRTLFSFVYKILFKCIQIILGIELPCEGPIGRRFIIKHSGAIVVSGFVKFGDNCRIRNAVVLCDVPSNSIAEGAPAVIKAAGHPGRESCLVKF